MTWYFGIRTNLQGIGNIQHCFEISKMEGLHVSGEVLQLLFIDILFLQIKLRNLKKYVISCVADIEESATEAGLDNGEQCSQKALVACAHPTAFNEITFATKKEDLDSLCP